MTPIIKAKIIEATNTNMELLCKSLYFGHETLSLISTVDSFINFINFCISYQLKFARVVGIEPTTNGFGDRYSTN